MSYFADITIELDFSDGSSQKFYETVVANDGVTGSRLASIAKGRIVDGLTKPDDIKIVDWRMTSIRKIG